MAFRATNHWRSILSRLGGNRPFAASTTPKMKPVAQAVDLAYAQERIGRPVGDFVPVCVALGMIAVSMTLGATVAKQQLAYAPNVRVHKKRREKLLEVEDPDRVAEETEKFISKSLFRKVGHIQEFNRDQVIPDPIRRDIFTRPGRVETLKSVGVDVGHN